MAHLLRRLYSTRCRYACTSSGPSWMPSSATKSAVTSSSNSLFVSDKCGEYQLLKVVHQNVLAAGCAAFKQQSRKVCVANQRARIRCMPSILQQTVRGHGQKPHFRM